MKKFFFILIITFIFSGCKSNTTVFFCEGVSPEGEGMNCGNKFSTGEITVIVSPGISFGASRLSLNVYKKGDFVPEKTETIELDVNPEDISVKTNLYFYDEGEFSVEVTGENNKKIAEGTVNIIDVY